MFEEISNNIVVSTVLDVENIPINEERPIEKQSPREPHRGKRFVW